jgi:hypothetical protein
MAGVGVCAAGAGLNSSRGAFPKNGSVGVYAEMCGLADQANAGEVVKVLKEFDGVLEELPR